MMSPNQMLDRYLGVKSTRKLAAYVFPGINCEGRKKVLSTQVGENKSAKYSVLNELRNRAAQIIDGFFGPFWVGIDHLINKWGKSGWVQKSKTLGTAMSQGFSMAPYAAIDTI